MHPLCVARVPSCVLSLSVLSQPHTRSHRQRHGHAFTLVHIHPCAQMFPRRKLESLLQQIDKSRTMDAEAEELLVEVAHDFVEQVVAFGCTLAKHRGSDTLEVCGGESACSCRRRHISCFISVPPFPLSLSFSLSLSLSLFLSLTHARRQRMLPCTWSETGASVSQGSPQRCAHLSCRRQATHTRPDSLQSHATRLRSGREQSRTEQQSRDRRKNVCNMYRIQQYFLFAAVKQYTSAL